MRREDLAKKLFDERLVRVGKKGNFYINFYWLAQREQLHQEFVSNLADSLYLIKNQHDGKLDVIFNMPECKNLIAILAKEVDIGRYAKFYSRYGCINGFFRDSDYAMVSGCISGGSILRVADTLMQNRNTHIRYGLYFVDLQNWSDALRNMPVKIYSTLTKADLEKALQNK